MVLQEGLATWELVHGRGDDTEFLELPRVGAIGVFFFFFSFFVVVFGWFSEVKTMGREGEM